MQGGSPYTVFHHQMWTLLCKVDLHTQSPTIRCLTLLSKVNLHTQSSTTRCGLGYARWISIFSLPPPDMDCYARWISIRSLPRPDKVTEQCIQAYKKANRALGMISHVISYKSKAVLLTLYKSFVRPRLAYCILTWSSHYEKDKTLLEKVQHRFTRMILRLNELSYKDRLDILGLRSLEERRNHADLLEMFKIFGRVSYVRLDSIFELSTNRNTLGHILKVAKHRSRLDLRKYFFLECVINRWNSLEQCSIQKSFLNGF